MDESASDALVFTLKKIVSEITENDSIRQFVKGQYQYVDDTFRFKRREFMVALPKLSTVAAFAGILYLSILSSGCGTILHGTTQNIVISSPQTGALAKVDGQQVVVPANLNLERKKNYTVTVEKEGYEPGIVNINRSFSPVSLLGILIDFGIISIPIDFMTGGAWTLEPSNISITLKEKTTQGKETSPSGPIYK